ncbi:MAG: sulfatase-like hydrolase/transferase [Lentisphaeraceae bacterium]|nr:sulfatase-like hydrolase/transferase [Lentisphaeraceae bacterium]
MLRILSILIFLVLYASAADKPNIIFIYTDDHGYADMGCQGILDDLKTPYIDELAKGGVRMTNGYSTAPQCCPSRAGLMTGRYQTRFDFEGNGDCPLPLEETTIATYLSKEGYATFHTGKWHLDANRQSSKFALRNSGMDTSKMSTSEFTSAARKLTEAETSKIVRKFNKPYSPTERGFQVSVKSDREKGYHLDVNNEGAVNFIEQNHQKPFFLYIAHRAPHVPLDPTEKYLKRFPGDMPERCRKALAMISCMDDGVGMILKTLRKHKIEEKTIIFFMSDNGAPYKLTKKDAPGGGPGWDGSLNDPWTGEKGTVMEGGIRLPYLVYWKGKIQSQVYDQPVITLDATATALELAGVKPNKALDGVNLVPFLTGKKTSAPHKALFWRWGGQASVRSGKYKFIELGDDKGTFLFDVTSKEHEHKNLLNEKPELAREMKKELANWLKVQNPSGLRQPSPAGIKYFDHYLKN